MGQRPALLALLAAATGAVCGAAAALRLLLLARRLAGQCLWQCWLGLQGVLAALLSWRCGQASWWWLINLLFVPGLWLAAHWQSGARLVAGGFVAAAAAQLEQLSRARAAVPHRTAHRARAAGAAGRAAARPYAWSIWVAVWPARSVVLAERYPQGQLRRRGNGAAGVSAGPGCAAWGDIPIAGCIIAACGMSRSATTMWSYCFLSPAPMPRLWQKARREMRPGSLLDQQHLRHSGGAGRWRVIELHDWRRSRLLLWQR